MPRLLHDLLHSPDSESPRPALNDRFETNVPGLYVAGELAGAPVVKLAMEQGFRVAREIVEQREANPPELLDVVVIGAGAAGLNAALEMHASGLRVMVVDKGSVGNAVAELPEGKWIYTEPSDRPTTGRLTLRECTKDELVELWREDVRRAGLNILEHQAVTAVRRERDRFVVSTASGGEFEARRVVVAIGKQGSARKLGVPGEDQPRVAQRLYHPNHYRDEDIVVIGGGNTAAEAAIALAEAGNRVTLVHRGTDLARVTKANRERLAAVNLRLGPNVSRFGAQVCELDDGSSLRFDHAFVLIGSEPPTALLRSMGIRMENEWTWKRWAVLAGTFALAYTIYGAKQSPEFWPFTGWGFKALSFFDRPWSFWYTVLYTALMTVFGIPAIKRWGFDRKDRFQIWRYASLLGFQWVFFFIIPEFLFQWAVKYQWVGASLAADPMFTQHAWRSYGIVYAWPLFFYTFFGSPHQVWIVWGGILSFVIIPVLALLHGKRYCSWICGCGGLAETVGDRWRHLAPKGPRSIGWERMNAWVLVAAVAITVLVVARDAAAAFRAPADAGLAWYRLIVDTWLVGIIPISLYPVFGGKVWCRYWCPLAKMMEMFSAAFTRLRVSRFAIRSNDKCIACGDCTRHCQVGIDVMRYALRQHDLTNANSSCIGCGICVTVCPMNVLSFARPEDGSQLVQIQAAGAGIGR